VEVTLRRRCRLRQCKYLNNVIELDHRISKSESGWRKATNRFQPRGGHYRESRRSTRFGAAPDGLAKVTHSPNCTYRWLFGLAI